MNNNKTIPIFILLAIATIAMAIPTTSITIATVEAQKFEKPSDPNDWGNVVSSRAQEESMKHSSNPFPGNDPEGTPPQDINRETPRDGVGNVQLNDDEIPKHPAFHADALCSTFGSAAPGCDAIDTTDDPTKDGVGGNNEEEEEEVEESSESESESVEKEAAALTSQEEDEEEEVNSNNNEEEEEEEQQEKDNDDDNDSNKDSSNNEKSSEDEEDKEDKEEKDDDKKEDKDE